MNDWIPLGDKLHHIKLFALSIMLWGLWVIRNKMAIEKKFPHNSKEIFSKTFHFLQKWRLLLKDQDAEFLDENLKTLKTWLENFWSQTDDMEIEGVIG